MEDQIDTMPPHKNVEISLDSPETNVNPIMDLWNRLTSGSVNRRIFGAAITIALLTFVVKAAGFIKDVSIAKLFGTSAELDIFILAFSLVSFPLGVALFAFQSSFIPVFSRYDTNCYNVEAQQLLSSSTTFCLVLMVGCIASMLVGLPFILELVAHGFSPPKRQLVSTLFCQLIPYFFVSGLNLLAHGTLQAGKSFRLSSVVPIFTPFATIVFLVSSDRADTGLLVWGVTTGAIVEFVVLQFAIARRGYVLLPSFGSLTPDLKRVIRQTGAMVGGALLMGSNTLIDQAFASTLDAGSIAALTFGYKVPSLITSLAATALATAILPYFSEMVANRDWSGCRHTLRRYSQLLLLVSVPTTVVIICFSEFLVGLMFQRGAFDVGATHQVAVVQQAYMLHIPLYLIGIMAVRLISAMGRNGVLTAISGVNLLVNIVVDWLFVRYWGASGIALATSVVYLISTGLCIGYVFRKVK